MAKDPLPKFHEKLDAVDADITLSSCDHVLFKLHRTNMLITSGGFPGPEFDTCGQIIHLEEPSNVLEGIFQFMYPERHPKVSRDITFELLLQMAEAAQKYAIYAAIDACATRLRNVLPDHALEILAYAMDHQSHELADACAIRLCLFPIGDVIQGIPAQYALPWVKYREECRRKLLHQAISSYISVIDTVLQDSQDMQCALAVCYWINTLLNDQLTLESVKEISTWFIRDHMDRMPYRDDYLEITGPDGLCRTMHTAVELIRAGIEEAEKESFSSYYLASTTSQ